MSRLGVGDKRRTIQRARVRESQGNGTHTDTHKKHVTQTSLAVVACAKFIYRNIYDLYMNYDIDFNFSTASIIDDHQL